MDPQSDRRARLALARQRLGQEADHPRQFARQWSTLLLVISVLGIAYATLFPFNFDLPPGMTLHQAAKPFVWTLYDPSNLDDSWQNVVLFGPFGFALACALRRRQIRTPLSLVLCVFTAALCSTSIEILQRWLPGRVSALGDIVTNTTGALLGALLYQLAGTRLLKFANDAMNQLRRGLSWPVVAALCAAWCAWTLTFPLHLRHRGQSLSNWNTGYPLVVLNTPDDGRLWEGKLSEMDFADAALSPEQLASRLPGSALAPVLGDHVHAAYRIGAVDQPVPDLTGRAPPLAWQHTLQPSADATPPLGTLESWLLSEGGRTPRSDSHFPGTPFRDFSAAAIASHQFAIRLACEGGGKWYEALHRIIAISPDWQHSNLIVGQQGYDLVVNLRTILSGDNGTNPSTLVPKIFLHPGRHEILVIYDDPALRLIVDGVEHGRRIEIPSDLAALHVFLLRPMTLPASGWQRELYRLAYFCFYFGPFGLLLGVTAVDPRPARWVRVVVLCAGLLLPCLLSEVIIVGLSGHAFRSDNLILGIGLPAVIMLAWAWWLRRNDPLAQHSDRGNGLRKERWPITVLDLKSVPHSQSHYDPDADAID